MLARAEDPWLALTAAMTHLDARALPEAAVELQNARRAWPETPNPDLDTLRASVELLASTQGIVSEPFPPAPDPDQRPQPALEALLHASRGTAEFANPPGVDVGLARSQLERALEMARAHDLAYLEVQSLCILATVAAVHGDLRNPTRETVEGSVSAAARRGRHPSGWLGGAGWAPCLRGPAGRKPALAAARSDEALGTWDVVPPEAAYTLHAVHGAALANRGSVPPGSRSLLCAPAGVRGQGRRPRSPAPPSPSSSTGVALVSGNGGAAAEVAAWLGRNRRYHRREAGCSRRGPKKPAAGRYEAARTIATRVRGRVTCRSFCRTASWKRS